jgi:transcriptional regulator with XRE-family HTH domain
MTTTSIRPAAAPLGPTELRRFRAKHKLRQEDLAQLLGISRLAIARWETSTRSVPPYMNLTLEGLAARLPLRKRGVRVVSDSESAAPVSDEPAPQGGRDERNQEPHTESSEHGLDSHGMIGG